MRSTGRGLSNPGVSADYKAVWREEITDSHTLHSICQAPKRYGNRYAITVLKGRRSRWPGRSKNSKTGSSAAASPSGRHSADSGPRVPGGRHRAHAHSAVKLFGGGELNRLIVEAIFGPMASSSARRRSRRRSSRSKAMAMRPNRPSYAACGNLSHLMRTVRWSIRSATSDNEQ